MKMFDEDIKRLLEADATTHKPNKAIADRLEYNMMLRNSRAQVRHNSFADFFKMIFSARYFAVKMAAVAIGIIMLAFPPNQLTSLDGSGVVDTLKHSTDMAVDSALINHISSDTLCCAFY